MRGSVLKAFRLKTLVLSPLLAGLFGTLLAQNVPYSFKTSHYSSKTEREAFTREESPNGNKLYKEEQISSKDENPTKKINYETKNSVFLGMSFIQGALEGWTYASQQADPTNFRLHKQFYGFNYVAGLSHFFNNYVGVRFYGFLDMGFLPQGFNFKEKMSGGVIITKNNMDSNGGTNANTYNDSGAVPYPIIAPKMLAYGAAIGVYVNFVEVQKWSAGIFGDFQVGGVNMLFTNTKLNNVAGVSSGIQFQTWIKVGLRFRINSSKSEIPSSIEMGVKFPLLKMKPILSSENYPQNNLYVKRQYSWFISYIVSF